MFVSIRTRVCANKSQGSRYEAQKYEKKNSPRQRWDLRRKALLSSVLKLRWSPSWWSWRNFIVHHQTKSVYALPNLFYCCHPVTSTSISSNTWQSHDITSSIVSLLFVKVYFCLICPKNVCSRTLLVHLSTDCCCWILVWPFNSCCWWEFCIL